MRLLTFIPALLIEFASFGQSKSNDIVIKNATVFNSRSGKVSRDQIISIKAGIIVSVTSVKKISKQ